MVPRAGALGWLMEARWAGPEWQLAAHVRAPGGEAEDQIALAAEIDGGEKGVGRESMIGFFLLRSPETATPAPAAAGQECLCHFPEKSTLGANRWEPSFRQK